MKQIVKHIILLCILITTFQPALATVLPIQLDERIAKSSQIIMAKAISAESYWDANKENIYTAYTMEARCYMKVLSSVYTFQLILRGGEVDGTLEIVTPNVAMEVGQEYVLMVENAAENTIRPDQNTAEKRMAHFQPFAHVQGVMGYKDGKYVDYVEQEPMNEKTMMETVKEITKMVAMTPSGEIYKPRDVTVDLDKDGVCSALDCDDLDPNYPKPVGAPCNDNNPQTENDQIQADGCTCAGNSGQPVDCENIVITAQGGIIRIDNLTAKSEKIEIIGSETNGQSYLICDGDCSETQYIEGLQIGNKVVQIWMYGNNDISCYKEFVVEITEILCKDRDNDNLCDIKDCAPDDKNSPAVPGTPCDDGNPNTLRDIYLIDGCTCAGVATCETDENIGELRLPILEITNGNGVVNPTFVTGTIEGDQDLIIKGSGFGSTTGSVEFPNSDLGGRTIITIDYESDFISWSDTEIRVKIPTRAGTGNLVVKNSSGTTVGTATINVDYAINSLYSSFRSFDSKTRQNIKFTNRNEGGGYTIQLNTTSDFAYSSAVVPLENAIDTWICNSGVNWQIDKSGTTTGFGNDGNCVVLYEPNLPLGVLAITTSRYKASGNTSCSGHNTVWYLKEFDIQFMPNSSMGSFSWNFGPWPPQATQYDFQSIALHELGHAHGLGHVINADEIMHYSVRNGVQSRDLTPNAANGCKHKIDIAIQPNCISSHEPMTLLPAPCGAVATTKSTSARVSLMLEGYYNTSTNLLNTNLLDNDLIPTDHPFNTAPFNYGQAATVASFPSNAVDWLLLELRDEHDMNLVIATQPVLVNSHGKLTDVLGNETIKFEGLDDKNYYIAIFHKSHLPIISSTAQPLSDDPVEFDFSSSADATMGNDQQKLIDGKYFMSSGDFDGNGIINSLDFNLWKQAGAAVNSYSPADADGNGIINSLDFNLWKANGSKVSVLNRGN